MVQRPLVHLSGAAPGGHLHTDGHQKQAHAVVHPLRESRPAVDAAQRTTGRVIVLADPQHDVADRDLHLPAGWAVGGDEGQIVLQRHRQPVGTRAAALSFRQTDPVSTPIDPALLDFAVDAVSAAGGLTLELFQTTEFDVERKDDGSPVTIADRGAERLLRERIEAAFPDDAIHGEEEDDKPGSSGRRWVIDPIDGTISFTHGVALFTNLLYMEDEHGPAIGVINVPALGELVAAGRGLGCRFNGTPCRVNGHDSLAGSVLSASGFDWWEEEQLAKAHRSGMLLRTWGDGYGYVLVATGRIEAMVDPSIHFWDVAPCQVIIDEAGGRWSALDGTLDAAGGSFVATNGLIHDALLEALR